MYDIYHVLTRKLKETNTKRQFSHVKVNHVYHTTQTWTNYLPYNFLNAKSTLSCLDLHSLGTKRSLESRASRK